MVIELSPQLEAALGKLARQRGVALETLVLEALQDRFLPDVLPVEPQDAWERKLFGAAVDSGVSVSDATLSSDVLYE